MTTGKGSKRKKITVVTDGKSAKDDTKDTSVENVKGTKDDTKKTSVDNGKGAKNAKDDNNDKATVQGKNEDTEAPIRPSTNNGGYSDHFDPIPAENKTKKNETIQMSTVDISK